MALSTRSQVGQDIFSNVKCQEVPPKGRQTGILYLPDPSIILLGRLIELL